MTAQVEHYLSRDGTADYWFRFEAHGNVWRAIIERQPAYGTRSSGAHESHRLSLPDGRRYVCWTPEPTTLEGCKDVARTWADCTQVYLATGRFGNPATLPETSSAARDTIRYLASDGVGLYRFRLVSASDGPGAPWHVEVVSQPPAAGRDLTSAGLDGVRVGRTRRMISTETFASSELARSASASWVEARQTFIATARQVGTVTPAASATPNSPTPRTLGRLERLRRRIG
jgi:hypothetical protein